MTTTADHLSRIVGHTAVFNEPERISSYFRQPVQAPGLWGVQPQTTEEVQQIMKVSKDERLPVFTTYDTYFPPIAASCEKGILLDFKRMDKIERIDPENLMVHVQRGVTFEQLAKELKRYDMKLSPPAAATSPSVVEQAVSRSVSLRAARYPEISASNMKVVLANGKIHLSGSHAMSEEAADHKGDPSANLSQWYWGADDIYGIVTRASIWAFPRWEINRILAFGFDALEDASGFIREMPRRELCTTALVLNRKHFMEKTGLSENGLSPWIAVIGVEGYEKLVSYRQKIVLNAASKKGGKDISSVLEDKTDVFETAWYTGDNPRIGCYCLFPKIAQLDKVVEKETGSMEDMNRTIVSVSNGGCVWLEYSLPAGNGGFGRAEEIALKLAENGAFFDRPSGKLAEAIYDKAGDAYVGHIKRIKDMVDPEHLINPGTPINL